MKTLISILVLFSSSVLAEVFNCKMEDPYLKYEILIDTGDEEDIDILALIDEETLKFKDVVSVVSVGKIYFKKPHPYSDENLDAPFYIIRGLIFQSYVGLFFNEVASVQHRPKIVSIAAHKNPIEVTIDDPLHLSSPVTKGTCE